MASETEQDETGRHSARQTQATTDLGPDPPDFAGSSLPLGRDGCPIRVLNFAGGGFDTIMQLGVAHALLVIQGRAPDAIVGVSAGAIQAVAVAEVMQAGENFEPGPKSETDQDQHKYRQRRAARVEKFRDMVKAAQSAPEELIDASLPDAYQVDSHDPLQPLQTARFAPEERRAREDQLIVRSGLVRLYNDVLRVHLPVGVVTRVVRRLLGVYAAGAVPNPFSKFFVQFLELFRIWLLIGTTLPRFLTLLPLLLRPFSTLLIDRLPTWAKELFTRNTTTAGSLIFRLVFLRTVVNGIVYSIGLFLFSSFWVGISAYFALLVYLLLSLVDSAGEWHLLPIALFFLPNLLVIASTFLGVTLKHDALTLPAAFRNSAKEFAQYFLVLFLLGSPLFMAAVLLVGADPHIFSAAKREHALAAFLFPTSGTLIVLAAIATGYNWFVGHRQDRVRADTMISRLARWSIVVAVWLTVLGLIFAGFHLASELRATSAPQETSDKVPTEQRDPYISAPPPHQVFHGGVAQSTYRGENWPEAGKGSERLPPSIELEFKLFIALCLAALIAPLAVGTIALVRRRLATRPKGPVDKGDAGPSFPQWYGHQFLKSYKLSRSLLHHYGLEKFYADLFDPNYYREMNWSEVWQNSLNSNTPPKRAEPRKPCETKDDPKTKKIADYRNKHHPGIALGLAVAKVGERGLKVVDVMDEDAPVVTGLKAATAWSPLFPPVCYEKEVYIDSMNVCPVPLPALAKLLERRTVNPESTVVQIYRVASVPFSRGKLARPLGVRPMLNLVDIVHRALKLRQLRDADLERRLAERYTRFIPPNRVGTTVGDPPKVRYRMRVIPIELDIPIGLNARIMFANRDERRAEILRTIAQGCRAALGVMIADSIDQVKRSHPHGEDVLCTAAVRHHLAYGIDEKSAERFGSHPLPGSRAAPGHASWESADTPPGLWEICEHCSLSECSTNDPADPGKHRLRWRDWKETTRSWPHEFDDDALREDSEPSRHFVSHEERKPDFEVINALRGKWPGARKDKNAHEMPPGKRPLVNLLFSGGVFRGVFQVGVINALDILGVKPDIVAGASVGSITGAMAAELLHGSSDRKTRKTRVALLATVYLAVDRVILTDRFADFVREFTVRASAAHFSLRQADRLFRRYDQPWLVSFDKGARRVVGGIERLLYVSPYQLNQLVEAARHRHGGRFGRLTAQLAQQWLNRMKVGEEVLGADALDQLMEFFLQQDPSGRPPADITDDRVLRSAFERFLRNGVMVLATATNLTEGRLLTLGDPFRREMESARLDLNNALLASSAFPGIFRPRWATEVFPDADSDHQIIDGGVMDNLPVEAVLNVLWSASPAGKHPDGNRPLIARRPVYQQSSGTEEQVPHLFFAASLEPEYDDLSKNPDQIDLLMEYWPALLERARQLGYNFKLDQFNQAAGEISSLYMDGHAEDGLPLDLEVCALKPKWLCDTYAFHPMLGFRRARQAESIAHGCAMTLLKFKEYDKTEDKKGNTGRRNRDWLYAWGVRVGQLPTRTSLAHAQNDWVQRKKDDQVKPWECWLRKGKPCPFSKEALHKLSLRSVKSNEKQRLKDETIAELSRIHTCCQNPQTHKMH